MSYINQEDQVHDGKNEEIPHNLLKVSAVSGTKVVLRHANPDVSTELVHEPGTTDMAVGDATAEIMITTTGKISNEMYYLEDTTPAASFVGHDAHLHGNTTESAHTVMPDGEGSKHSSEIAGHSMVFLVLLIALVIILLLCCITACLVARSKRRNQFFGKTDMECEPGCSGINQPLLDKISDATNKTSVTSMRK